MTTENEPSQVTELGGGEKIPPRRVEETNMELSNVRMKNKLRGEMAEP